MLLDVAGLLVDDERFMEALCEDCPEIQSLDGDDNNPPEDCCPCYWDPFDEKCPKSGELNRAVDILEGVLQ